MSPAKTLPIAAAALMMLGACVVAVPPQPGQISECRAGDAAKLVGQINPSDEVVRAVTGAEVVRQLGPNDPMTMDLRLDRATIIKDPATGRVLQASCG